MLEDDNFMVEARPQNLANAAKDLCSIIELDIVVINIDCP